jgi:hypothetical protein
MTSSKCLIGFLRGAPHVITSLPDFATGRLGILDVGETSTMKSSSRIPG